MTDPSRDWEFLARSLAEDLASELGATLQDRRLTEVLLLFSILPSNPRATSIDLLVSPFEVTVTAGEGSRVELRPLPEGDLEVRQVVHAVAGGRLTESIRGRRVQGRLVLDDGHVLRFDLWGAQRRYERKRRVVEYEPFELPPP